MNISHDLRKSPVVMGVESTTRCRTRQGRSAPADSMHVDSLTLKAKVLDPLHPLR